MKSIIRFCKKNFEWMVMCIWLLAMIFTGFSDVVPYVAAFVGLIYCGYFLFVFTCRPIKRDWLMVYVTMYLTVSVGNEGEGTNHTWEEVNTYSAYDYDEMGVDRYKVAGLLQVGNEEGLIPGEFGYGQLASNCTVHCINSEK